MHDVLACRLYVMSRFQCSPLSMMSEALGLWIAQVGKVGDTVLEGPDESIFFAASALPTVCRWFDYWPMKQCLREPVLRG